MSAMKSNVQPSAPLHFVDVPLSKEASRQRVAASRMLKKKSNDFEFPSSSESSQEATDEVDHRVYQPASKSNWGAKELSKTSDKENLVNDSGRSAVSASPPGPSLREVNSTAETTLRSPAKSAEVLKFTQLAVPHAAGRLPSSSSGGTNFGTQEMSLQIGTAPSVVLSNRPTVVGDQLLRQISPDRFGVCPDAGESQEQDDLAGDQDDDQMPEKDVVPSTSEADPPTAGASFTSHMDLDNTEDSRPSALAARSGLPANMPDEVRAIISFDLDEEAELLGGSTSYARQHSINDAQASRARVRMTESTAMSFTNSTSASASASNGRGVDPPAGRSLQRSRPNSLAQLSAANLAIEGGTQSAEEEARSQTQKIPTSDAPTEQILQGEKRGVEVLQSSPASEGRTRMLLDSQHAGRAADRTIGNMDIIMMDDMDAHAALERPDDRDNQSSTTYVSESTVTVSVKPKKGKQRQREPSAEAPAGDALQAAQKPVRNTKKRKSEEAHPQPLVANKRKKAARTIEQSALKAEQTQPEQGTSASAAESSTARSARVANAAVGYNTQDEAFEGGPSRLQKKSAMVDSGKARKGKGRAVNFADLEQDPVQSEQSSSSRHAVVRSPAKSNLAKAGAGPASKTGRKSAAVATVAYEASQNARSSASTRAARVISHSEFMPTEAGNSQPMDVDDDDEVDDDEPQSIGPSRHQPIPGASINRVYVRLDKYFFPGVLTLAEDGNMPFRVQMDDTSFLDLHVHQLAHNVVKCQLHEGDVVVRASNADGVQKSKAKMKYEVLRILEAGTPEGRPGKQIAFGNDLDAEDLAVVRAVLKKGEDASDVAEERWLVEATVLLPVSANAVTQRKLSSEEIDELQACLQQSQSSTSISDSSRRSSSSRSSTSASTSTSVSSRVSASTSNSRRSVTPRAISPPIDLPRVPSKLFAKFGLIFTSG